VKMKTNKMGPYEEEHPLRKKRGKVNRRSS
jgi:hypothetical protein